MKFVHGAFRKNWKCPVVNKMSEVQMINSPSCRDNLNSLVLISIFKTPAIGWMCVDTPLHILKLFISWKLGLIFIKELNLSQAVANLDMQSELVFDSCLKNNQQLRRIILVYPHVPYWNHQKLKFHSNSLIIKSFSWQQVLQVTRFLTWFLSMSNDAKPSRNDKISRISTKVVLQ